MRTSEEIYHRVRWDPRFDPARFVLGVTVRGAEPQRMAFSAFVPGGDIPWHRIRYIEADGETVWDRTAGVDRIDETRAGRVEAPRLLRPPFFTPTTPHAWDGAGWRPAPDAHPRAAGPVRVLTWNTLWDRYDQDQIATVRRRPLLLAEVASLGADIIALQEVQPDLLALLLDAAWVRDGYTMSARPSGRDVDEHGLVLLSRLPVVEAATHRLGPFKALCAVTVRTSAGPLVVANTHLTSDHSADGATRRQAEFAGIVHGLSTVDASVVVLGDFNDGGDAATTALDLRDAWSEVHGAHDWTPTFDPTVNPLAAVSSRTGRAARLDRVLVRGDLLVAGAARHGDRPSGPDRLYPSDHFAVVADLLVGSPPAPATGFEGAPTARTAVAWIPPEALWAPIQRAREVHDRQFSRWPPHVNLLFGFVPEADFERALPSVVAAAREVSPFTAMLAGVRSFRHRDEATVWLDPAAGGAGPWMALRAALASRFPRCQTHAGGFTPHLTLGRTGDPRRITADLDAGLGATAASVGEIALLSRRGDEPMTVRVSVALGTGEVRWQAEPAPRPAGPAVDAGGAVTAIAEALPDSVVHVVGSRRLGCALPDADLDLVVAVGGTVDIELIRRRVTAALPDATRVRHVIGARVPGLRLRVGALGVDIVIAGTGGVDPAEAVARRSTLGLAEATALSAVSDADAILEALAGRRAAFVELARAVKWWARVRGLDSAPHGGLPGVAWTILAARTTLAAGDRPHDEVLREFFAMWAAWDWRRPVALHQSPGAAEDPVTVLMPSAPARSCTEQVSAGWRDLLVEELYSAWEADGSAVLVPPVHRRHAAWAIVAVPDDDEALGRVRGRIRALLTALEDAGIVDAHAWPRPFSVDGGLVRSAIGLGRHPPSVERLAEVTKPWLRGQPGVTVRWAENGAVPTLR